MRGSGLRWAREEFGSEDRGDVGDLRRVDAHSEVSQQWNGRQGNETEDEVKTQGENRKANGKDDRPIGSTVVQPETAKQKYMQLEVGRNKP